MELLDKGKMYNSQIKQIKHSMIFFSVLVMIIPISAIFFDMMSIGMILFYLGLIVFINLICYWGRSNLKSKINNIDKMTDVFDEFIVTTQIISKSQESKTNVFGQQGYVSSSTHHTYIVGVRTLSGHPLRICSKNLYMSSREGEYVDIVIKQKLDKNDQVLDSSYIPLLNTIKQSI